MLDERGGISPFGWAIACGGQGPSQLHDEVQHLARWSIDAWARHFPAERGYRVDIEHPANNAQGVRLSVRRGEFHAQASLEYDLSPHEANRSSRTVRLFGRAQFDAVVEAHRLGERLICQTRGLGWGGGVAGFLFLAWTMIGVRDPIFVLGGMLLVVALLLSVMAGGTLGAWFGDRLAEIHRARARRQVDADPGLRDDIRRWKAISRQLTAQRSVLLGSRRQPFRSEPRALAG